MLKNKLADLTASSDLVILNTVFCGELLQKNILLSFFAKFASHYAISLKTCTHIVLMEYAYFSTLVSLVYS